MSAIPEQGGSPALGRHDDRIGAQPESVGIDDASRLLAAAAHDIAVASMCIGLRDLDEAHTNVLTARVAADAAEEILRTLLQGGIGSTT